MTRHDDALAARRRYFMRHDAHRYIRPDAYRYMKPGATIDAGRDVAKRFRPHADERHVPAVHTDDVELSEVRAALLRLKYELAAVRADLKFRKLLNALKAYNPNQPRVPAGGPNGGQWTSGGEGAAQEPGEPAPHTPKPNEPVPGERTIVHDETGEQPWKSIATDYRADGRIAIQTILNRDGSMIRSEFSASPETDGWDERHMVVLPDGSVTTFQNAGATQTVFDGEDRQLSKTAWTKFGPEPQATVQPAFWQGPAIQGGRIAVQKGIEAGLALFTWLSGRNDPDGTAVVSFNAHKFVPGIQKSDPPVWVGRLSQEEVSEACPRYPEVQQLTNESASALDPANFSNRGAYGTAVHRRLQLLINGHNSPTLPPRDHNFRAELSILDSKETRYGRKGSKRADVFENPLTSTVCIHEIKTGDAVMSFAQALKLASAAARFYPGTRRIILTQVKPARR